MGTEDITKSNPLNASVQAAFAQSVAMFVSGVIMFLMNRLFHVLFHSPKNSVVQVGQEEHRAEHRAMEPRSQDVEKQQNQYPPGVLSAGLGPKRRSVIRATRILFYSVIRVLAVSTFFFILVVASISLYVWRPEGIVLAEIWSIFVSGLVLPCCVMGVKSTVTRALKDLAALFSSKNTSKYAKNVKYMEIVLLSSKSTECFFNITKVALILSLPSVSRFTLVSFCAILSQLTLIIITTKLSLRFGDKKASFHQDIALLAPHGAQPDARQFYMKLLGIASITKHPLHYQNTSLWSLLLMHEFQATSFQLSEHPFT